MTLGPGSTVDRYRLVAPAGEGGQGSVWRAEDPLEPGKAIALKIVPLNATPLGSIERFRREAHALARLSHPSLPRCHALFEDLRLEVVGISLDFIEGSPLSVLLASEELTRGHRVWILRHLAAALAYIHDAGLVHRDVKPPNVMITKSFLGHPEDPAGVKLVDFGIAAVRNNPTPITVAGSVIGTNEFLAPEILDRTFWNEASDGPERDVFALGVLAYELLLGAHPAGVSGDAPVGDFMIAYRRFAEDPAWPSGAEGDELEPFLKRALTLRASKRARSGAELVSLLDALGGRPPGSVVATGSERGGGPPHPQLPYAPTATSPLAVRRSNRLIAGTIAGGALIFTVSFAISYNRPFPKPTRLREIADLAAGASTAKPNEIEEPPNPGEPPPPNPGSSASPPSPAAASNPGAGAAPACPEGMVGVAAQPPFCIDKHEVWVSEYRRGCQACGPAKEAFWTGPSFTEAARKEQTANCTNTRAGLDNYPINCVSYDDAVSYCTSQKKRLPHMSEWRVARSHVSICGEVGGVCPMFEWSADPTNLAGYRSTRGPSFRHATALEGSNIELARNDDLGFRCAADPLPAK